MVSALMLLAAFGWPSGPTTNTKTANVLIEVQRIPPAQIIDQKDQWKSGGIEGLDAYLVRLSNGGRYAAALFPVLRDEDGAKFHLVDGRGQETGWMLPVTRWSASFPGLPLVTGWIADVAWGGKTYSARLKAIKGLGLLLGEGTRQLLLRRCTPPQCQWLSTMIVSGPEQADADALPSNGPSTATAGNSAAVLWPHTSVWGYILFQLAVSTPKETRLECDFGKGVTWATVTKSGLEQEISYAEQDAWMEQRTDQQRQNLLNR